MEKWKKAVGYEKQYLVSNLGRVKSIGKKNYGKILKNGYTKSGYCRVTLTKDKKEKSCAVHRLVAMAWVRGYSPELCVDHKNFIRDDNRVTNLEWVTHKENVRRMLFNGRVDRKGNNAHHRKLTSEDVLKIRSLYKRRVSTHESIAKMYNVSRRLIGRIINRERWDSI